MRTLLTCLALSALCLGSASNTARADTRTVFDNGAPDHQNGNSLGFAIQAEDFTLDSANAVTGLSFWTLEAHGAYRGNIWYAVRFDAGGRPGAVIASGSTSDVERSVFAPVLGLAETYNVLTMNEPVLLGPGTYWLTLHNGGPGEFDAPNEFLWETAAANASTRGQEAFGLDDSFNTNFNEHAFSICAVPEPARAWMLAAGLAVLAGARMRRRA
jgi:hypothetical protein